MRPLGRDEAGLVAPPTAASPQAGDSLGVARIVHYAACRVGSVPDDSRPASTLRQLWWPYPGGAKPGDDRHSLSAKRSLAGGRNNPSRSLP